MKFMFADLIFADAMFLEVGKNEDIKYRVKLARRGYCFCVLGPVKHLRTQIIVLSLFSFCLCIPLLVVLVILPSDLYYVSVIPLLVTLNGLILYICTACTEPGIIPPSTTIASSDTRVSLSKVGVIDESSIDEVNKTASVSEQERSNRLTNMPLNTNEHTADIDNLNRYCTVCNISQDVWTRHCYQCNACIKELDHHCSVVGFCIGARNKVFFAGTVWLSTLGGYCLAFLTIIVIASAAGTSISTLHALGIISVALTGPIYIMLVISISLALAGKLEKIVCCMKLYHMYGIPTSSKPFNLASTQVARQPCCCSCFPFLCTYPESLLAKHYFQQHDEKNAQCNAIQNTFLSSTSMFQITNESHFKQKDSFARNMVKA